MSDALPIPSDPDLDRYEKLAEGLERASRSADPGAMGDWAVGWLETLARLEGADPVATERRAAIAHEARRIQERWRIFIDDTDRHARCLLSDAQLFVAREHGFNSWPTFASHIEALKRPESAVSAFEAAVDAIVAGDAATLARLLRERPELVRARSTRDHRSTLLHYVSANGVEDFRQITPSNIVEITRILLEAGADVNATSDAYGGGSTALGLAATSLHPQRAGVQIALLEMLLGHGARIEQDDGAAITGCLANGQPEAARYLASRGAVLNLEGAAGLGRLDVVRTYFGDGNAPVRPTAAQLAGGFLNACGYGHVDVVRFLLERGVDPDVRNRANECGLHWASFGPHPEVARLLLNRQAAIDVRDDVHKGTPLDWVLFSWAKAEGVWRERGYEMVNLLVRAGAEVETPWLESHKVQRDSRMLEILRGRAV